MDNNELPNLNREQFNSAFDAMTDEQIEAVNFLIAASLGLGTMIADAPNAKIEKLAVQAAFDLHPRFEMPEHLKNEIEKLSDEVDED